MYAFFFHLPPSFFFLPQGQNLVQHRLVSVADTLIITLERFATSGRSTEHDIGDFSSRKETHHVEFGPNLTFSDMEITLHLSSVIVHKYVELLFNTLRRTRRIT
jgi:hypothetical protein